MAGGSWVVQNRVRPGAYINFVGSGKVSISSSDRGVVTMPLSCNWGPVKEYVRVDAGTDFMGVFGYDLYDEPMLLVKEALKRASAVVVYRISGGTKATKTSDSLTVAARYEGTRGNDITVKVAANPDIVNGFIVTTYLDSVEVDVQQVAAIDELTTNDFVTFSGTGALTASAGIVLSGGTDTAVQSADYTAYLNGLELQEFNTMALPVDDVTVKGACVSFVKRMREDEGKKIQVVLADYSSADYEGVISVKNGVVLADGTVVDKVKATAWVAGATAGAEINQSNTYTAYDDAVDTDTKYTNSQIVDALNAGEWVFVPKVGKVVVEQDINSLSSFSPEKGRDFHKNRVIRVLDEIGNTIRSTFENYYIGKADNNDDGRLAFKGDIISYFSSLQAISAIQNFDSGKDVEVVAGNDIDAVVANVLVQPVDSMEKLYMTVKLK